MDLGHEEQAPGSRLLRTPAEDLFRAIEWIPGEWAVSCVKLVANVQTPRLPAICDVAPELVDANRRRVHLLGVAVDMLRSQSGAVSALLLAGEAQVRPWAAVGAFGDLFVKVQRMWRGSSPFCLWEWLHALYTNLAWLLS